MAPRNTPLSVEIPTAADDRPAWTKVGIVAAVGFAIGIAWPKLTHTHIAPSPPNDERAASAPAAAATATTPRPVTSASAAPPASASAAPPAAASSREQSIVVGPGTITKCRDGKTTKEECGTLQIDPLVLPRMQQLAKCPSAVGLSGKLSIGFDIDFKKKAVHVLRGKSTTLPRSTVDGVMKCASSAFANVPLDDVPHDHQRYTLFYAATFYPPGKTPGAGEVDAGDGPAAGSTSSETAETGTATVAWDTAIVRDRPKSQTIAGRMLRGTKVKILGRQGDWYHVQYGTSMNHEGWVYRGAIGL